MKSKHINLIEKSFNELSAEDITEQKKHQLLFSSLNFIKYNLDDLNIDELIFLLNHSVVQTYFKNETHLIFEQLLKISIQELKLLPDDLFIKYFDYINSSYYYSDRYSDLIVKNQNQNQLNHLINKNGIKQFENDLSIYKKAKNQFIIKNVEDILFSDNNHKFSSTFCLLSEDKQNIYLDSYLQKNPNSINEILKETYKFDPETLNIVFEKIIPIIINSNDEQLIAPILSQATYKIINNNLEKLTEVLNANFLLDFSVGVYDSESRTRYDSENYYTKEIQLNGYQLIFLTHNRIPTIDSLEFCSKNISKILQPLTEFINGMDQEKDIFELIFHYSFYNKSLLNFKNELHLLNAEQHTYLSNILISSIISESEDNDIEFRDFAHEIIQLIPNDKTQIYKNTLSFFESLSNSKIKLNLERVNDLNKLFLNKHLEIAIPEKDFKNKKNKI